MAVGTRVKIDFSGETATVIGYENNEILIRIDEDGTVGNFIPEDLVIL